MIQIRGLMKSYPPLCPLRSISLDVVAGERIGIQGPSGSGKTTLLRLVAGLELPDKGEIWISGRLVSNPSWAAVPFGRGIGMVFQRNALWPHMNVAQNVLYAMNGVDRVERFNRLRQLLDWVDLGKLARSYPNRLSGGEARRVALARALADNPPILLLDEPFSSLDPDLKEQIFPVLLEYQRAHHTTMVWITHDEEELGRLGGRNFRLENGILLRLSL